MSGYSVAGIIPNPIDDVWFESPIPKFDQLTETVVSASRYVAWKGVARLAHEMSNVLRRCDTLSFQIFGAGPELSALKECSASLSAGRFCVNGWADRLWEKYAQVAIYASCSTLEAFGRGGAEAMASGLPLIVPAAGGLGEMVRASGAGTAFDPNRESALEEAVLAWHALCTEEKLALGLRARAYASREFRADVVAGRWLELTGLRCQ